MKLQQKDPVTWQTYYYLCHFAIKAKNCHSDPWHLNYILFFTVTQIIEIANVSIIHTVQDVTSAREAIALTLYWLVRTNGTSTDKEAKQSA